MLRARAFPALPAGAIVLESEDVLVVDKPPFVPSQASGAAADDLPARLAAHRVARGDADPYVGVHQRLDRATSGLVVYAKRREANAWLARAFEGRTVEKEYVAAVASARSLPERARWEDALREDEDGLVRVVKKGTPRSVLACTEMRVVERRGERALVRLRIETGRTHQIRAQLAHRGAPIAGDAWYGGAPWRRLLLASVHVAVPDHLDARLDPPRSFADFLAGIPRDPTLDLDYAREILGDAAQHRHALAHDAGTSCFRWLNDAADGAPGIAVDVYGEHVVLHAYDERDVFALAATLVELGARGVYLKRRPKRANDLDEATARALAPPEPIAGEPTAESEIDVLESGVRLRARLGDGLSTGLFLDQRAHRARVRELSGGARVLNLFSYTCAFSIFAALGGAREVVSVDAARKQLERGTRGFEVAGLDPKMHETIADDAFAVLDRFARRGRAFDLVVCDPPTYSSAGKTRFTSGKMWKELAARVLRVLAPHGAVLATTNDRRASQRDLRAAFHEASRATEIRLASLRDLPAPVDFPAPIGTEPHLKGVIARR